MPSATGLLRCLHGVADDDDAAARARDRALHQEDLPLGIGGDDLEVQGGDLLGTEVTGHPRPLEHPGREGAGPDRSWRPMVLVVAVARALALEVVPLHRPCE